MAASRALNPRAPPYIPLSYTTQTHFTNFPIHHLPFFPTASQPPLLHPQSPLYAATYPPPPPAAASVFPQRVRIGATSWRPRAVSSRGRRATSGFRSSKHHRKVHNFGRTRRYNNNKFGFGNTTCGESSSSCRYVEKRTGGSVLLKKHDVLHLKDNEEKTTVMIKNIPKLYNGELLLKFLDEHCLLENQKRNENCEEEDHTVSAFDFMYLPIDFRTGFSRGFAFVNFTEARAVWKFFRACNEKPWDLFHSRKIREIVSAKIQGKEALVKHFERSIFHCESDEFLPVCFNPPRDGSGTELVEQTRIGRRIASNTPNV